MRYIGTKLIVATVVIAVAFLSATEAAFAKILPVTSIEVTTPRPMAGHRAKVLVRFAPDFTLGDGPWAKDEVSVISADKTDTTGWLRDPTDRGTPVSLRRVGDGVFGGTFVMSKPGNYVVFARSSVAAREDRLHGVVTARDYAPPVLLRVAASAVPPQAARATLSSSVALWVVSSTIGLAIGAALVIRRGRTRRGPTVTIPTAAERDPSECRTGTRRSGSLLRNAVRTSGVMMEMPVGERFARAVPERDAAAP